jgi:hypothetical protein
VTICIVAALFGLIRGASQAEMQAGIDLTGLWAADNGATFYVRQIGNTVWWAVTASILGRCAFARYPYSGRLLVTGQRAIVKPEPLPGV